MNKREKTLLILIGGSVGLFIVYNAIQYIFISPVNEAQEKIAKYETEINRSRAIVRSRESLVRRWSDLVGRTLSYDSTEVSNRFAKSLKDIAKNHPALTIGSVSQPSAGMKIGSKTGIETVAYRIVVEGKFSDVLAAILDLYKTPYLCQITRLSLAPLLQKGHARDEVKLEFTIETPVPPVIDKKQVPEASNVATIPAESDTPLPPVRATVMTPQDLPLLAERVIFRPYVPPPENLIVVDNQDWKTVFLQVDFLWDGKVNEQVIDSLPSKTSRTYKKKGDFVEVKGAYQDGKPFGPERFDFNARKDFTYQIPVHSDPPAPVVVDLAVDNQDKDPIDVDLVVIAKDGAPKSKPTIRVKAHTKVDLEAYECTKLDATATYASGKKTTAATFKPAASKQTYMVPPEPAEAPVAEAPKPVTDPAPDSTAAVTGLLTYRGVQEMVVSAGNQRRHIPAGEEGVVDGGHLLGVHPLGGVVKMPSGNYYLYPLGMKFTDRIKLDAQKDEDLPAAIDAWTRR
jgi:hypothetical protein